MADTKTNVMRVLESRRIPYTPHQYEIAGCPPDGATVARLLGQAAGQVFKTLVTRAASGAHYVFVVPVAGELDLKAAARAVGEKSIVMIRQAELLPLTGYVHGGCSPVGMKKQFPTVLDESARTLPAITVSAGRVGFQVELSPTDLCGLIQGVFAPVVK